tara:strand:+ start:2017 stop:2448 length:432 start_codon:yes stop_codon:yes gene_type:complete
MYEYKIIETTHRYAVKSDKSALAVIVTSIIGAEPDAKEGYINMDDKDNMYVIARNYEDACKIVCKHYHDAYIEETTNKVLDDDDAAEEAQYRWENGGEQDALEAMWDRQEQEDAIVEGTAETNFGATSSLNERRVPNHLNPLT